MAKQRRPTAGTAAAKRRATAKAVTRQTAAKAARRRAAPKAAKRRAAPKAAKRRVAPKAAKRRVAPKAAKRRVAPKAAKRRATPKAAKRRATPKAAKRRAAPKAAKRRVAPKAAKRRVAPKAAKRRVAPKAAKRRVAPKAAKRRVAPKAAKRRVAPKAAKRRAAPKTAARRKALAASTRRARRAPVVKIRAAYAKAVALYEKGLKALQRKRYSGAAAAFRQVLEQFPEERELHERARLYLNVCERETKPRAKTPKSVDDRILAATLALNRRDVDEALSLLRRTASSHRKHDHIQYMLALAHALHNDVETAAEHLAKAIALNSSNRLQAKQEPDFDSIRGTQPFLDAIKTPSR